MIECPYKLRVFVKGGSKKQQYRGQLTDASATAQVFVVSRVKTFGLYTGPQCFLPAVALSHAKLLHPVQETEDQPANQNLKLAIPIARKATS